MKVPIGFEIAGITGGLKRSGRPDLGLIYSPFPLAWALMATTNLAKAPCVSRNRGRVSSGAPVRGLVVNSGNANCATGDAGIWANEDFAGAAASALALDRVQDMLTASTGVIGKPLPIEKMRAAMPDLVAALGQDTNPFSEAILTTDLQPKQVAATLSGGARIVGIAKGSGMIHPNMATMFAFVLTDASFPQETLREIWPEAVRASFNQLTVDTDTSTNDMAILLSSRQVAADRAEFEEALASVCQKLAQKIARDGEGATKLVTVHVRGARTQDEARLASRTIAASPLVKTAAHGSDPNWGRILAAVGRSGAVFDLGNLTIELQGTLVYRGVVQPFDDASVAASMRAGDVDIVLDLAAGEAEATAWGCDLSAEYVRINADYRT